jgi:hypothetical protein
MDARQDRADLARLRAELAAITERTLARTKARSDASRRGWATRHGRVGPDAGESQVRVCGDSLKELQTIMEPVAGSGSLLSRVIMDPPWPPAEPIISNPPHGNPEGCGDCDPCLGGRPDQCAVMAIEAAGGVK